MTHQELLSVMMDHLPYSERDEQLGELVGNMYTDHGLPIDMALDRLPEGADKVVVLNSALNYLVKHKRKSGAQEKAIERTRKSNLRIMEDFIKTGETGVY